MIEHILSTEIADRLKEAGYPQPTLHGIPVFDSNGGAYKPTLPELITACGSKFRHLSRYEENGEIIYKAMAVDKGENVVLSSPNMLEAVALLYIATHTPAPDELSVPKPYPDN